MRKKTDAAARPGSALITGASSGMGLEFARQLAGLGYDLLMVSNREGELAAAAESIREGFPVRVESLCADLSVHGAAGDIVAWCDSTGLDPDVLVNNAGMFFMEYLSAKSLKKADAMMALHMETVTDLSILLGARMKARRAGRILIMSSLTARIPAPGIAVYSASKAYLKSFGKGLSHELRPFGVTVTTICPAAVDTALYSLSGNLRKALKGIGLLQSPKWLVSKALKAMFRGRRTLSPGVLNRVLPPLIAILPGRMIDRLGIKWIYMPDTASNSE